jgi:hypothetical protein
MSLPPGKGRARDFPTNPFDDPASAKTVVYCDGLVSHPIGDDFEPAFSAVEAIGVAAFGGDERSYPSSEPKVVLRSVSAGFEGQDESFAPHPAWVLI